MKLHPIKNPRNAGRKALPEGQKKVAVTAYLLPATLKAINAKYGTVTLALEGLTV